MEHESGEASLDSTKYRDVYRGRRFEFPAGASGVACLPVFLPVPGARTNSPWGAGEDSTVFVPHPLFILRFRLKLVLDSFQIFFIF